MRLTSSLKGKKKKGTLTETDIGTKTESDIFPEWGRRRREPRLRLRLRLTSPLKGHLSRGGHLTSGRIFKHTLEWGTPFNEEGTSVEGGTPLEGDIF